ncbi:unnamed protein product, partial [Aphanomyces euteiches]
LDQTYLSLRPKFLGMAGRLSPRTWGFIAVVFVIVLAFSMLELDLALLQTATKPPHALIFSAVNTVLPKHAYMLYATDARTVCNAIIMAHNIRASGTPREIPIVVLVTNDVPSDYFDRLHDAELVPIAIEPWRQIVPGSSDFTWTDSLAKLRIFQERGYDKVIYLDSDAWLHRNLDHLFALGDAVLWAPHAYYIGEQYQFGSTLLVLTPSNALFGKLEQAMKNPPKPNYYDMDDLNDLWRLDCGYLPSHYVVLTPTLNEDATFGFANKSERINKTYIHHFTVGYELHKPWLIERSQVTERNPSFHPLFYDLFFMFWKAEAELCPWL